MTNLTEGFFRKNSVDQQKIFVRGLIAKLSVPLKVFRGSQRLPWLAGVDVN